MDPNVFVVKDKTRLLTEVMRALAGDAYISFEGDLSGMPLCQLPGCSRDETATLKRNTSWPQQDFIVLPLEPSAALSIIKGIGGTIPNAYSTFRSIRTVISSSRLTITSVLDASYSGQPSALTYCSG
jgi:hypothetical protein